MKIIGINGSPRKNGNSAKLLAKALEGAAAASGLEPKTVDLYDLQFRGCRSCFACKRLGAPTFGRCAWKDDLEPLLDEIHDECAALVMASPIYFGDFSGEFRCFIERLVFPYYPYEDRRDLFGRRMPVGLIADMNVSENLMKRMNYEHNLWSKANPLTVGSWFEKFMGPFSALAVCDTWQFPDYSKYSSKIFDPVHKAKMRDEQFPKDLERAYEFGKAILATN